MHTLRKLANLTALHPSAPYTEHRQVSQKSLRIIRKEDKPTAFQRSYVTSDEWRLQYILCTCLEALLNPKKKKFNNHEGDMFVELAVYYRNITSLQGSDIKHLVVVRIVRVLVLKSWSQVTAFSPLYFCTFVEKMRSGHCGEQTTLSQILRGDTSPM